MDFKNCLRNDDKISQYLSKYSPNPTEQLLESKNWDELCDDVIEQKNFQPINLRSVTFNICFDQSEFSSAEWLWKHSQSYPS